MEIPQWKKTKKRQINRVDKVLCLIDFRLLEALTPNFLICEMKLVGGMSKSP